MTNSYFKNERRDSEGKLQTTQLFTGIILEIECHVEMPKIVFYPNLGNLLNQVYNWSMRDSRPSFKLEANYAGASDRFQIYTDDLKRAKELLNEKFAEKLVYFSKQYQPSKQFISAAFEARKFYLAISLPNGFMSFNVGNKPLNECNDKFHQAMKDLMIPREVIDILLD